LTEIQAAQVSPLSLAFVGDSVFDLYVRAVLVREGAGGAGVLHSLSSGVVNARAQAVFSRGMEAGLTERERRIFLRGRNAKSATVPKNMSVADYRYATAAEALVGYLYLTGQSGRLEDLLCGLEILPYKDKHETE
jgi:ribonuclease-3 family protein